MRPSTFLGIAAASLLTAQPVLAQASPSAQRLSLANSPSVRAHAGLTDESAARGGGGWIIGLIGVIAGVTYAFVQQEDDEDDEPASP